MTDHRPDALEIAGERFDSRILIGTAGYPSRQVLLDAIERPKCDAIDRIILDSANLVCGTTLGILQHPDIRERRDAVAFDLLVVDEASKTTFQEVLDWGVSQSVIEQILGTPMPNPLTTIKDFCTAQGLSFETVKAQLQAEVDKAK